LALDSLTIELSMVHNWRSITYLLNHQKPMISVR